MIDGKRLRELREAHGYSRRELAKKIDIADSQIVRYEMEKSDATGDVLSRLASTFGVSVDYLLGRTDEPGQLQAGDLQPEEIALIDARRRGDLRAAMKILAGDE